MQLEGAVVTENAPTTDSVSNCMNVLLLLAAIFALLGTLCSAWAVVRRARTLGGRESAFAYIAQCVATIRKAVSAWFSRTVLRKTTPVPQYLRGTAAGVFSAEGELTVTRSLMPSSEPERSDWLARRVADLSIEVDQVKHDTRRTEDEHAAEISKLNHDLGVAKEEFSANILRLSSDGFGLEVLATLLLLIAGVLGLLGLL